MEDHEPVNTKIDEKVLKHLKTCVDTPDVDFPGTKNKKLLVDYAVYSGVVEPFRKILGLKNKSEQERQMEEFGKKIVGKLEEMQNDGLISEKTNWKKVK